MPITKHRDFNLNDPLPSAFVDAMQTFLATYRSPYFNIYGYNNSVTAISVDPGSVQIAVAIQGSMRWAEGPITATMPAGSEDGYYDVYATTRVLDENAEDAGTFDYSFDLVIVPENTLPATTTAAALRRQVAKLSYTGTIIADVWWQDDGLPYGTIIDWYPPHPYAPLPWGYELCDTRTWSSVPNDFNRTIGNLPESRDHFAMGVASETRVGEEGGLNSVTLASTQMPVHNHTASGSDSGHVHAQQLIRNGGTAGSRRVVSETIFMDNRSTWGEPVVDMQTGYANIGVTVNNAGGSGGITQPHENRPAFFTVLKLMKVRRLRFP